MSTTHSPVGGKQSERSQLTFSWLLGKYTPRAVVSVCIRVTGARPRATCVSAAMRVSLLKEALLSRFYRRTETPVHRPRPIRERERGREKGNRDERNRPEHERTNGRKRSWTDARSSIFPPKEQEERSPRREKFAYEIFVARDRRSKNLGSRCRHARCARVRVAWAERKGGLGSLSLPLFFSLSFRINACGWKPREGEEEKRNALICPRR